jgi:hypothetical protein
LGALWWPITEMQLAAGILPLKNIRLGAGTEKNEKKR